MDLHEEKVREDLIQQKETQRKLVEIIPGTNDDLMNQLTETEKIAIAERYSIINQRILMQFPLLIQIH